VPTDFFQLYFNIHVAAFECAFSKCKLPSFSLPRVMQTNFCDELETIVKCTWPSKTTTQLIMHSGNIESRLALLRNCEWSITQGFVFFCWFYILRKMLQTCASM